nr:MAG TPA: hypothetical protein [Caudoviricetes sp.]
MLKLQTTSIKLLASFIYFLYLCIVIRRYRL